LKNSISQKKISKIFGFNKDREGLIKRYLNEKDNWKNHLQNSKKYILKSAENKKKGNAVILGSGWWLDLPYKELSEMFSELFFIDITHPVQIIHKAKKYPNINLITADISCTLNTIYKINKDKLRNTNLFNDNNLGILENISPDFVVSLNILNQLSFFPKKYMKEKRLFSEKEIEQKTKEIEQNHIKNLPENKSCLITDFYQYEYNNKNVLLKETRRLKTELPENNSREEWIWDFDLKGNFINNRKIRFKVAALQV